jgi:hypothetical protein
MEQLKTNSFYILIGLIVHFFCKWIESSYLMDFLDENLITILIALLAINTTTSSIVMTKLQEIIKRHKCDFKDTLTQLKISIIEQLIFIASALTALILINSQPILEYHHFIRPSLESFIIAVFIASIHNLYDTASSIFVIIDWEYSEN